jgi:hypothetical protein
MPGRSSNQLVNDPIETDAEHLIGVGQLPAAYEENRRFPRFPFRGRAKALVFSPPSSQPQAEPEEYEILTSDLSREGVGVLHRKQLFPGQQLMLMLHQEERLVEVCWCCRVWSGLYVAGCRFINESSETPVANR